MIYDKLFKTCIQACRLFYFHLLIEDIVEHRPMLQQYLQILNNYYKLFGTILLNNKQWIIQLMWKTEYSLSTVDRIIVLSRIMLSQEIPSLGYIIFHPSSLGWTCEYYGIYHPWFCYILWQSKRNFENVIKSQEQLIWS